MNFWHVILNNYINLGALFLDPNQPMCCFAVDPKVDSGLVYLVIMQS